MTKIISKKDVEKVADLARIAINAKEKEKITGNLNDILDYFKDLSEAHVGDFEKLDHYEFKENQLRKDKVNQASDEEKEAIRSLFPDRKENHLRVKAVLNGSH